MPPEATSNHNSLNGDDGTRTHDFRLAKPALSQLSYVPEPNWIDFEHSNFPIFTNQSTNGPGKT